MNFRYDLIKPEWLETMAIILTIGAEKHKVDDFSGKTEEEYFQSAMGHIVADRKGIPFDDDKMPTIVKAAVNLLIIYSKRCGTERTTNNEKVTNARQ